MRCLLATTCLILATGSAVAPATRAGNESALDSGSNLHGVLALSLADSIATGLENNLDLEIERHAPLIAEEDYRISWSPYDPVLGGEAGYDESDPATGNPLLATTTTNTGVDGSVNLGGLLPYIGASYDVSFLGDRTESDIFITTFNPEYTSDLIFSASVPLLRGLVWNEAWTGVKTSAILRDASDENFRTSVMAVVQEIETNYWNLIAVREQLAVAHKSLETAKALLDQVQTQYEVGVVSRVEVVEAEAGVAEREFNLIVADNQYRTAQDDLINVVLGPNLTGASTLEVDPTEPPEAYQEYEIDVPQAVNRAFANRPEIRAAEYEVEQGEIQLRFRKNERLPQLDLRGTYGLEGLSGRNGTDDPITPEDESIAGAGPNFQDAPGSFFGSDGGDSWNVRAIVSVPIGNIAGRHGVSRAELELRRSGSRLKRLRQDILLEVRRSARNLLSGLEGIEAAERRRLAAEEQLRAERVRLEHGESTPFEVLQRESDLVDAESQKINALQTYRNSEIALLRAQGTILEARNVVFEDVARMR